MKVTTKELERCEILMTIQLEPDQERDLLKKAARRISEKVQVPGFRRGKAPYNTMVHRFGLEAVQQELLRDSSEEIVKDALKEAKLEPQAQVKFDDEVSWDPLTIKVRVPGPPVVKLGDYRKVRLEAKTVTVTGEDVDEALKTLQEQNTTWVPVERMAEVGDLLTMSMVEKDGDEVLVENEAMEYELTAPAEEADKNQPDFLTPLLGLSAGESKTFTINFPPNWAAKRQAGKEITFEVAVSSVKVKELDPLDDDFAQAVGDVDTLAELKEKVRADIEQRRAYRYNQELGRAALDKIIEGAGTIEWSEAFEEYHIDQQIKRYEQELSKSSLTLDSYLQMQKKTPEELREEIREKVTPNLKVSLVLGKIADLEGLEVSNVEILERAKMMAELSGGGDQFWQNILASQAHQTSIANDLLADKVIEQLTFIARGEAPEADEAEAEVDEEDADEVAGDEPAAESAADKA